MIEPMKALTVWNPWAWLLAFWVKRFETRSWATNYRGLIAIHAAALDTRKLFAKLPCEVRETMLAYIDDAWFEVMPRGCIVATAELVECWPIVAYNGAIAGLDLGCNYGIGRRLVAGDELLFGDFTPGRDAWEFANMQLLPPIPAKGRQGLWTWEGVA